MDPVIVRIRGLGLEVFERLSASGRPRGSRSFIPHVLEDSTARTYRGLCSSRGVDTLSGAARSWLVYGLAAAASGFMNSSHSRCTGSSGATASREGVEARRLRQSGRRLECRLALRVDLLRSLPSCRSSSSKHPHVLEDLDHARAYRLTIATLLWPVCCWITRGLSSAGGLGHVARPEQVPRELAGTSDGDRGPYDRRPPGSPAAPGRPARSPGPRGRPARR